MKERGGESRKEIKGKRRGDERKGEERKKERKGKGQASGQKPASL